MKTKIALSLLVSFTACLTTLVATSCKTGQTPWQNVVTDVTTVIDCTKASCAVSPPVCSAIEAEVLGCIPALVTGNPATCMSLVNGQNGSLLFADVICVIDAFSTTTPTRSMGARYLLAAKPGATVPLPTAQAEAAKWGAYQHIGVIRVK